MIYIKSAKYIRDYKIRFTFSNHVVSTVDFEKYITAHTNLYVTPYGNKNKFKKFCIDSKRNITWGRDYDFGFYFKDIYRKKSIPPSSTEKIMNIVAKVIGEKKVIELFIKHMANHIFPLG